MPHDPHERTVPLFEEELTVGKAAVATDHVRVSTSVEDRAVVIEEMVERGELHVERIAVDQEVSEAPGPRHDGDTLIVSVVEERLVAVKRLFVIEELRITRTCSTQRVSIADTVRTMHATVEHASPSSTPLTGKKIDG